MAEHPSADVTLLLDTLCAQLPAGQPLLLGLSGGLDSVVLLHALVRAGFGARLRAVHVNHGLHADAGQWQQHCEQHCEALAVPLQVCDVTLAPGGNLEARAREARYQAINALREPGEALVLAHHRDDQAETILFRLLRGAGVPALAGMQARSERHGVTLHRPLLNLPRALLAAVAAQWRLQWIDDPSNASTRFDRNFLRHEVLPVLARRWPASERLVQAGQQFAEAGAVLNEVAEADATACDLQRDSLNATALARLSPPRRHNLLSWWLRAGGQWVPERQILERVASEVLAAGADRNPVLRWSHGAFARHGDRLWRLSLSQLEPLPDATSWNPLRQPELSLASVCTLRVTDTPVDDALCLGDGASPLTVARAVGGERLLLRGMHRQVSELWRVAGVPVWQRARLPLFFHGDTLVAAAGIGVADDWQPAAGAPALCICVVTH